MKTADLKQALLLLGLALLTACPAAAFPAMRSVPPESFLDYHVDTVPQLSFEVAYDSAVRARLAHHFHLSGPALCAYVRNNMVLQHLRRPLKTRVYCVRPDGREFFVIMTLKTGTPVFALRRTGEPILRLVCGNPLVAALPPAPNKAVAKLPRAVKTHVAGARLLQATPQAAAPVTAPAASLAATTSLIQATGAGDVFLTSAGGSSGSWLGWVPLAGGTLAFLSHSGGGTGTGGSGGTSTGAGTPLPIGGLHQFTGVIASGGLQSSSPGGLQPVPGSGPQPVPSGGGPLSSPPGGPQPVPSGAPLPVPEPDPALALLLGGLGLGILRLIRSQRQRFLG